MSQNYLALPALLLVTTLYAPTQVQAQVQTQPRMILIDQDGSGPGGSNQMSMMALLQSPQARVLGITMVTGNAWRDEEAQHTLRMLELIGRTDVPVALGAVYPLVRTQRETELEAPLVGNVNWLGAWGGGPTTLVETKPAGGSAGHAFVQGVRPVNSVIYQKTHGPYEIPPMPEGAPHLKAIDEDAVHFLIHQVHAHPHQVTIFACGPLTNIALAISLDPEFASLTQGIILMGGSLSPETDDPEFAQSPRHEFNFWFDPEAAHIVLRADWPDDADGAGSTGSGKNGNVGVVVTTVDVSVKVRFTQEWVDQLAKSAAPAAQYIAKYSEERYYMWDEITALAWLDPTIITKEKYLYMDVDITHGPEYGNTLTWLDQFRPSTGVRKVHAQMDLDLAKFEKEFVALMSAPAPQAR